MTYQEMLNELGFNSFNEITEVEAKKRYRKLMKANHPDLAKTPEEHDKREAKAKLINEAYEKLNKLLQRKKFEAVESKRQDILAIIPLDSIVALYDGNSIELQDSTGKLEIRKSDLRLHRIILESTCSILDKKTGLISVFTSYTPFTNNDTYEINCKLQVSDSSDLDIEVSAYGKKVVLKLSSIVTTLRLTYKYRVQLILNIQKVIVEGVDNSEVK